MKQRFLTALLLIGCVCMLSACGEKNAKAEPAENNPSEVIEVVESEVETESEEEVVIHTPDAAFLEGYEEGDFDFYTSLEKPEDHMGEEIWIDGAVIALATVDNPLPQFSGKYAVAALVQDKNDHVWSVYLGTRDDEMAAGKEAYNYEKNGFVIEGIFLYFQDDLPLIVARRWFSATTGEITSSNAFSNITYNKPEQPKEEKKEESASKGEVSKEFKAAMDQYEEFFDEYIEFMKSYDATDTKLMMKYLSFMTEYVETMSAMEGMNQSEMNEAELKYYTETMLRIQQKLADASLAM